MKNLKEQLKKGKKYLPFIFSCLVYGIFSLIFYHIFKRSFCPVKLIFGIPCTLCGITRALISLLRFDFAASFVYHPLLLPIIIFFGTGSVLFLFWDINWFDKNQVWMIFAFVLLAVYAVRMIAMFPSTEPMLLNKKALIFLIFS